MTKLFFMMQHKPFEVEILPNPEKVKLIVIDLFAGVGGTSWGMRNARDAHGNRLAVVAVAVNHYLPAIKTHHLNMPNTIHFIEDVRTLDVYPIREIIKAYKEIYVNAEVMLWASAPCQEHSVAKAGQPLDVDNRTLPNDLLRYIEILQPDRIGIENVRQFQDWGPLIAAKKKTYDKVEFPYTELKTHIDKETKEERLSYRPNPERKGEFFEKWKKDIKAFGYDDDWTFLNAADFGAYTSRNRLFGQFVRVGKPIHWPMPTHDKHGRNGLPKWKKAKDILDLHIHGKSIFNRKKRLSKNTIRKLLDEIEKSVERGEDAHIHKYYGSGLNMSTLDEPIATLRQKDCMYYIKMIFNQYGNSYMSSLEDVVPTIPVNPKQNIVSYVFDPGFGGTAHSVEKPLCTIVASQNKQPLEHLSVALGNFDTDVANFLDKDDILFLETGIGVKSVFVEMLEFCIKHGIRDVYKRGLSVKELCLAQGFPADYKFSSTQTDSKMGIGNSVSPVPAEYMTLAICLNLKEWTEIF